MREHRLNTMHARAAQRAVTLRQTVADSTTTNSSALETFRRKKKKKTKKHDTTHRAQKQQQETKTEDRAHTNIYYA